MFLSNFDKVAWLLVDAIKRTIGVSNEIAMYAMLVDTIDERQNNSIANTGSYH